MKTTNLSIQEAIQSGLPFKRQGWASYRKANEVGLDTCCLTDKDILATDWQIKLPEVTITREKLAEAWDVMVKNDTYIARYTQTHKDSVVFDALAKELGL